MVLQLSRFSSDTDSTLGLLHDITSEPQFLCYTLEDEFRTLKVWGETRIPKGVYKLKLRSYGGFHNKYKERFKDFHKGMIEIENVKGFQYVLIHIGNDDEDTAGCVLLGDSQNQNMTKRGRVLNSTEAYKRVYKLISNELHKKKDVYLIIKDLA